MVQESWINWYIFPVQTADFSILWNQVIFVWTPDIFVRRKGVKEWRARPCLQQKPIHDTVGPADLPTSWAQQRRSHCRAEAIVLTWSSAEKELFHSGWILSVKGQTGVNYRDQTRQVGLHAPPFPCFPALLPAKIRSQVNYWPWFLKWTSNPTVHKFLMSHCGCLKEIWFP